MSENTINVQEKFRVYLEMQKELAAFRKKQAEQKKVLQTLEDEIKEYMKTNDMDSIALKEGEIVLYDRKVSQTFKRPVMVEKIAEKLKCDTQKAEDIAESIFANKVFSVEQKIKANIKKSK
jgi:hypothetical protein